MTAHGTMETAIAGHAAGRLRLSRQAVRPRRGAAPRRARARRARGSPRRSAALRTGLKEVWEFGALVGRHPAMQEVYKTIGRVAASDVTVLLRGESGTGKELVARAIHHYSRRAGRPFVAINCAAIPEHAARVRALRPRARGVHRRQGAPARASSSWPHGGTLFLDEIGDMPPGAPGQAPARPAGAGVRAGGRQRADPHGRAGARGTHRDLEAMMKDGRFREDLFYRLNVVVAVASRRCGSGARTSRCSSSTSSRSTPSRSASG